MRIAVINETSAADRNADIVEALENRGHEIFNLGMKKSFVTPEITYIHTGLMSGLVLDSGKVDFVVGGCGTGQGFLNAAMQYPGIFCGHILTPLDAWLFAQINHGNCVSLMLNQGYGWGSNVQLKMIFDALFDVEWGGGYPPHRQESQQHSVTLLKELSTASHKSMDEIVAALPTEVVEPVMSYPGFREFLATT